ncbi:MAG: hypothetical protein ACOX6T_04120 [Myxococcales bacterium]
MSALDEQELARPDPYIALNLHRRVADKFLKDGNLYRAFGELMRAAQTTAIDGRLAKDLAWLAKRNGFESPAAGALAAASAKAIPESRNEVRRHAARLMRRLGKYKEARVLLAQALEESPGDRRARRLLCLVSVQEGSYELAAENLAREIDDDAALGRFRRAARNSLGLARLFDEGLGDTAGAASAYARSAENAQRGGDSAGAFSARVLAARALAQSKAPPEELEAALRALIEAGRAARREAEAAAIVGELGKSAGPGQAKTLAMLAEAAFARGNQEEAVALLREAVEAAPADEALAARLESHFIGRGAWSELAAFYRERAAREESSQARAELLAKLAEVLEDELGDKAGAAEVYARIVEETGDPAALGAQVRLLSASTDPQAVQAALDAAVRAARDPKARAEALLLRGEVRLAAHRTEEACADFEAALELSTSLRAIAGLAECRADRRSIERFEEAFRGVARGAPGRGALARRLARLLEWPLGESERAGEVWREVLAESPADAEAEERLIDIARTAGAKDELIGLLRRRLAREPRGPSARATRHELATLLEELGRDEEALAEWRMATRMEPGDAVALLALADRCERRGRLSEAAFALEGAAAATEAGPERAAIWLRLAKLCRGGLSDPARAAACEERARVLREKHAAAKAEKAAEPSKPAAPADPAPRAAQASGQASEAMAPERPATEAKAVAAKTIEMERVEPFAEPAGADAAKAGDKAGSPASRGKQDEGARAQEASAAPVPDDDHEREINTGDILEVVEDVDDAPAPALQPVGGSEETPTPTNPMPPEHVFGAYFSETPSATAAVSEPAAARPAADLPPPAGESKPAKRTKTRKMKRGRTAELKGLLSELEADPLDPGRYHALAEYHERVQDPERVALMEEIANALRGDPFAEPLVPRFTLDHAGWEALRHPQLRATAVELFGITGPAMCAVNAVTSKEVGAKKPFSMTAGKGAKATAESLLAAVRVLGIRAPEIFIGSMDSPPLWAVNSEPPMLLVGKLAVSRVLPDPQLRFFAGRALAAFRPELMPLRLLSWEKVAECIEVLKPAVYGERNLPAATKALARRIPGKSGERLAVLLETMERRQIDVARLSEGARHTANRAGLLVAGGVAPAVTALRAKREATEELIELLRFAASNKYLALRSKR